MGQYPNYDEVASLLAADELQRKARFGSGAYFNNRQALNVGEISSASANMKGLLNAKIEVPVEFKKFVSKKDKARLRIRERKAKLDGQFPEFEEPVINLVSDAHEDPEYNEQDTDSDTSFYENAYGYSSDYDEDKIESPVFDDGQDSDGYYDESEDVPSEPDFEYDDYDRQYDESEYYHYYDDADYHDEFFERKWKHTSPQNSFY
jgi:hypothetical protein